MRAVLMTIPAEGNAGRQENSGTGTEGQRQEGDSAKGDGTAIAVPKANMTFEKTIAAIGWTIEGNERNRQNPRWWGEVT